MAIGDGPFLTHYYKTAQYVWELHNRERRTFPLGAEDDMGYKEYWT
ncbi:MAG: hypothetical protein P8J32_08785 [bacterium]|nr:hypothetical protein [bacterium]